MTLGGEEERGYLLRKTEEKLQKTSTEIIENLQNPAPSYSTFRHALSAFVYIFVFRFFTRFSSCSIKINKSESRRRILLAEANEILTKLGFSTNFDIRYLVVIQ